jgi:uncharacterized membrane protein YoaT (DUF817 family)
MSRLPENRSAAAVYAPLAACIAWEERLGRWAERSRGGAAIYEFLRFGMKQAWACLFGGLLLALLLITHMIYPAEALLTRYDFLVLAAVAIQIVMLVFRLETMEEAKVILVFHVIGTAMEIFKTAMGSWVYPEPSVLRIGGVPLFSGFMYAAVGSYLARVARLFDFEFTRHPPLTALAVLSVAIYANYFLHHFVFDARWLLVLASVVLFGPAVVHYRIWRVHRRMPLLLGLALVAAFIWLAENIATFSRAWIYPHQSSGWQLVSSAKFVSWFLLMIISYTLVMAVQGVRRRVPEDQRREPSSSPVTEGEGPGVVA